ncbi:MAG: ComEA family DNA-binding protein [bacterium]
MSKQQFYLTVLLAFLVILAAPGFFMETPQEQQKKSGNQVKKLDPSVRDLIPNTTIDLEPTTEEERQEIVYSRKININEADPEELQEIPRVGEATAQRIVDFREAGGVFYRVDDLTKIKRIGERTVENMRPHVTVGRKYEEMEPEEKKEDKIDINTASREKLQEITRVGAVTAADIIAYRDRYGGFSNIEELKKVKGIGSKTFDRMKDQIEASAVSGLSPARPASSSAPAGKININTADNNQLQKLTGIGPATARKIIEYREKHGHFSTLDDLSNVSGIGPVTVDNIRGDAEVR